MKLFAIFLVALILFTPVVSAKEIGITDTIFNTLGYFASNIVSIIKVVFLSMSSWFSKHIMRDTITSEQAEEDVQKEIALNDLNNDILSGRECCKGAKCYIYPRVPCTQTCVDCSNAKEGIIEYFS